MIDKSPERIQRFFDQVAPKYDLINHVLSFGLDFSWRRHAVKKVYARFDRGIPDGPLLDVCCGTADFILAFYREYLRRCRKQGETPNGEFYGVDFSPFMLEKGEKKIKRARAEQNVILKEGDALQLPFEDNQFSIVSVAFGLRNVADTDRGIQEMVRVCKPGGQVAILDFGKPKVPVFSAVYQFYFTKILPMIGRVISGNQEGVYDYFTESVQQFDYGERLSKRLQNAGLIRVESFAMTGGVVLLYLGEKPVA